MGLRCRDFLIGFARNVVLIGFRFFEKHGARMNTRNSVTGNCDVDFATLKVLPALSVV